MRSGQKYSFVPTAKSVNAIIAYGAKALERLYELRGEEALIKFTIPIVPVTKKNSGRIVRAGEKLKLLPSKKFEEYQDMAGWYIPNKGEMIDYPVEVSCTFFMPTKRKVDLANLLNAICDVLVHYKVLADDNSDIIVSHDKSRVIKSCPTPRTEVRIRPYTELPNMDDLIKRVTACCPPSPELFELISAVRSVTR